MKIIDNNSDESGTINIEERTRRKRRRRDKKKAKKEKQVKKRKVVDKSEYDTDDTVINEDTDLVPKTVKDKEVPDDESLTLKRTDSIGEIEIMLWLNKHQ